MMVSVFLLSSCNIFNPFDNKDVITIGKSKINEAEFKKEMQRVIFEMGMTEKEVKENIEPIIDKVIEKSLIMEYGKEKGITVSNSELESAIRNIEKDYPEDVFKNVLLQRYIEFDEWKEDLREELLIKKIITMATADIPPVTFNETKDYFDSHQDEFKYPQMVQLRQIVTHTREEAETVLEHLSQGHDMGEEAKKYSIAPESENGGILGWIAKGELEESMDEVIFSLPVSKIGPIVESPYGFHIFEVLSKRNEGQKNLTEAMAEIEAKLFYQKRELFYANWIRKLRDRFPVSIKKEIYSDWSMEG